MKNIFILTITVLMFSSVSLHAQAAKQTPLTKGNGCKLRYYYYPNLEAYYDLQDNVYIFQKDGAWQKAEEIPSGYRGYGLKNGINVPITDYDDDEVTQFIKEHKKKYPYVSGRRQLMANTE